MFLLLIAVLLIAILVSVCADIAMRIELSKQEVSGEKLSWWSYRGGDQVSDTYHQLFPKSRLPLLRDLPLYTIAACAGAGLIVMLLKAK